MDALRCKSLVYLLQKAREIQYNADYLRNSRCGGSGTNVTTCCPVDDLRGDLDRKATRLLPSRAVCGQDLAQSVSDDKITKMIEFPWAVQVWYSMLIRNRIFTEFDNLSTVTFFRLPTQ